MVQAYLSLKKESYTNFLHYYDIEIKNEEVEDLTSLVNILYEKTNYKNIFNAFYVGYKIPQIGKEFDLLRFGEEYVINLELKRTSTEDKIKKQLKRNKYYLSFIGKEIHNLSFISDTEQLYYLNDSNGIEEVDFSYLTQLLESQKIDKVNNIDNLFNPSDYLVSPFNSTDKFTKNEYFLTHHQEYIKSNILKIIKDEVTASFISVTGSAGTGKTLLIYDIANEIRIIHKKVLIIHCGYLNNGHHKLNNEHGWNIIPIKDYSKHELSVYDVIIIDEAQRIYLKQLEGIVKKIQSTKGKCIFSYDKLQILSRWEERNNIEQQISDISSIVTYKLSEKIRTNKEIASFIKSLFNNKRNVTTSSNDNIKLNYFKSVDDAKEYLESLNNQEWEVLHFTPSQYNNEHHEKYSDTSKETSHGIIGQEFDGVVVTIDELFSYNENGELIYRGKSYYHPVKMLFQNITRTRKRLNIVIIDNGELLDRCLTILQG